MNVPQLTGSTARSLPTCQGPATASGRPQPAAPVAAAASMTGQQELVSASTTRQAGGWGTCPGRDARQGCLGPRGGQSLHTVAVSGVSEHWFCLAAHWCCQTLGPGLPGEQRRGVRVCCLHRAARGAQGAQHAQGRLLQARRARRARGAARGAACKPLPGALVGGQAGSGSPAAGEEGETCQWSGEGALFEFAEGWRERGRGELRVNSGGGSADASGRLVMRTKGTARLLLNGPLWPQMAVTPMEGGKVRPSPAVTAAWAAGCISCLERHCTHAAELPGPAIHTCGTATGCRDEGQAWQLTALVTRPLRRASPLPASTPLLLRWETLHSPWRPLPSAARTRVHGMA